MQMIQQLFFGVHRGVLAAAMVAVLGAGAGAGAAVAQDNRLLDATAPQLIADAILSHGFRAQLETGSTGNPIISSSAEGANFTILFYGCQDGRECRSIQYVAGFRLNDPLALERINDWNKARTIGQAYIADSGAIRLTHFQSLRHGVTQANLLYMFDLWRGALRDFMPHIGYRS